MNRFVTFLACALAAVAFSPANAVQVDAGPAAIAQNVATGCVYVGNKNAGTISVIDSKNDAVVATIPVPGVAGLAVNPLAGRLYASSQPNDEITVFDITPSPDGTCTTFAALPSMSVANGPGDTVQRPWGLDVDPVSGKIVVANYSGNNVVILDPAAPGDVRRVTGLISPLGVAVDSVRGVAYVTEYGANKVRALRISDGTMAATVGAPQPWGVTVDQVSGRAFVANYSASWAVITPDPGFPAVGSVSIATTWASFRPMTITSTLAGWNPADVPGMWIAGEDSSAPWNQPGWVQRLDMNGAPVGDPIRVCQGPVKAISANATGTRLYVACYQTGRVETIDTSQPMSAPE